MGAILYPSLLGLVGGGIAAVGIYLALNWVHIRFQLALEYRLNDLERRVNHQSSILGSYESKRKKNVDSDLLEQITVVKKPTLDLDTWRKAAFARKV